MESGRRVEQMKAVQAEALELFTRKNADYGDAFAKYGVIGVLMRIEDKLQRSLSITKNGVNLVADEGIRDTLIDLHNYAAMALMLLDEWKNLKTHYGSYMCMTAWLLSYSAWCYAPLAQLVRARILWVRGHGFESRKEHFSFFTR